MPFAVGRYETTGEELKEGFCNEEATRVHLDMGIVGRYRNARIGQQSDTPARAGTLGSHGHQRNATSQSLLTDQLNSAD